MNYVADVSLRRFSLILFFFFSLALNLFLQIDEYWNSEIRKWIVQKKAFVVSTNNNLISIDSSLFTHHSDINKKMIDKKMTTSHPMSWGRSNYNSYKCIVSSSLRERTLDLRQLEVVHLMWRVNKRRCRCNAAFDTLYETVDWHFIRIFYQSVI